MFERFTERARQVVVLAQEESQVLKHDYIGTEHILLGLLRATRSRALSLPQARRSVGGSSAAGAWREEVSASLDAILAALAGPARGATLARHDRRM